MNNQPIQATMESTDSDEKNQSGASVTVANGSETPSSAPRDHRFWCIIVALCITSLLASLENTVVVTALPTIVADLSIGSSYVWIANAFFLTRCPLFLPYAHSPVSHQPPSPSFSAGGFSNKVQRRHTTSLRPAIESLRPSVHSPRNSRSLHPRQRHLRRRDQRRHADRRTGRPRRRQRRHCHDYRSHNRGSSPPAGPWEFHSDHIDDIWRRYGVGAVVRRCHFRA
jgi:hypothetical protein